MIHLLALQARRDRVTLAVWVLGVALLLLVTVQAATVTYGTVADRQTVLGLALATPALLAFRGVPDGDSLGSAVHFQSATTLAVAIALMNTFLAVRHGRGDEDAGRRELLDSTPLPRLAAPLASLLLAVVADVAVAVLAVAIYTLPGGLDAGGAVLSAAGLALTGLAFFGVGLLASEAMTTSRAANGVAVVVVLLAYALRAAGDALGTPDLARLTLQPALPSAFSPIGWVEALRPFTHPAFWPIPALAGLATVLVAVGLLVHRRREPGAGIVAERTGPAAASGGLGGALGLAWRLHRGGIVAWTAGAALLAGVTPALVTAVARLRTEDDAIRGLVTSLGHSRADLSSALTAGILVIVGVLAAAAGVQAMLRGREEEASGRAEVLLAGPLSRSRWLLGWLAVAAATVVIVVLGAAAAIAAASVAAGQADLADDRVRQTLVQLPSALALTALAALLVAAVPRFAVLGAWALFAAATVIGLFGGALRLPDRVIEFTPVGSVPALPTDDWGPTGFIAATSVLLTVLALAAMRRRQIAP